MALAGGAAVGGCFAGVLATTLYQKSAKRGKAVEYTDRAATLASADGLSSPHRFPFASPGGGWRNFQSPGPKPGSRDLSDARLTSSPADLSKIGSMRQDLDEEPFVALLGKLIGISKYVQNNPRLKVTPEEKKPSTIVIDELRPYSTENGGPLIIEELEYVTGRPNLKVVYPGTTDKSIAFVGSHLDVVPADPEAWNVDPFQLTVEGDKLYGRGTTDCLGHVALITRMLVELGKSRPPLKASIIVVFISAEEGGEIGVGVDMVVKHGKLDDAKKGPVYWVDCADSEPCCGTSGTMSWSLTVKGRLFHSGFPHKGINSIELVSDAMAAIQERFYDDFPPHEDEGQYQFACGSNMKPTQVECKKGSTNQICPEATMHGDIRLSPFYDCQDVCDAIDRYIKDINDSLDLMPTRGPYSHYALGDEVETQPGELKRAQVIWNWVGDMEKFRSYEGIACSLDSAGHKALVQAVREAKGSVKPFSVNGSLPLVKQMQKAGFDLQLVGFGLMKVYHGIDEYCTISGMNEGYKTMLRVICLLEMTT